MKRGAWKLGIGMLTIGLLGEENVFSLPIETLESQWKEQCGVLASGIASQKSTQCQAARDTLSASKAHSALWKVWSSVTAVCALSCALSSVPFVNHPWLCPSIDAAATIADGIVLKNFISILTGLGGAAAGVMVNQVTKNKNTSESPPEEEKKSRNWGACLIALTAGYQVYSHARGEKTSLASTQESLRTLVSLASTSSASLSSGAPTSSLPPFSPQASGLQKSLPLGLPASKSPIGCGQAASSGSTLQCALANDSRLPSSLNQAPFLNQLQTLQQMPPETFWNQLQDPSQAILGQLQKGLPAEMPTTGVEELKGFLHQLESQAATASLSPKTASDKPQTWENTPSMGSSGVFQRGTASFKAKQDPFETSLQNLFEKMLPQAASEKTPPEMTQALEVLFEKSPATGSQSSPVLVFWTERLTLFQRVSGRYALLRKQASLP